MFTPTHLRHRSSATTAGATAARVLEPLFAARGFPAASILSEWRLIVGAELAAYTAPERIVWPRSADEPQQNRNRKLEGATLTIRVAGPLALDVQHESDRIIERLNTYFGWRAVTALRIVQGPMRPLRAPAHRAPVPRPAPSGRTVPEDIASPRLRAALLRLGRNVKSV